MKILNLISCCLLSLHFIAQEKTASHVDIPAQPIGGMTDFNFVVQSQMVYPDDLLKKKIAADVSVYFRVNSKGLIDSIEFKQNYHPEFQNEALRLLRYFQFLPAKIGNVPVASKTSLVFKFHPDFYKKYCKYRGFIVHKDSPNFDTSFVVYERADSSPDYYKGEEALTEFISSNLEYPDLAIRQGLQGTVILSFIVEPNGTISNISVEKEFNHLCTNEALRVMRETKWKPGTKNGKMVRYKTKYPIIFNLNNVNKDNATSEQR